ncbi:MAG TPA: hypothetical protein DEO88_05490 [Syntrophobacteraceae bacterium]|jgi:hypothetical protein|nr:hypothetical protein [Syntrophobacteraceae bacterium]
METVKTYIGEDNTVTIRCAACGRKKTIDAVEYKTANRELTVKCQCGHSFSVAFEWRKFYRKQVALAGEYIKDKGSDQEVGEMVVEDIRWDGIVLENLGMGGLAFQTNNKNSLKKGDIIHVTFTLDDVRKSPITRNVVVKSVNGRVVRAEFCDNQPGRALMFYMMA